MCYKLQLDNRTTLGRNGVAPDPAAVQSGKPLWSSEDYAADNTGAGGRCQARILNQVREILVRVFPPDLYSVLTA